MQSIIQEISKKGYVVVENALDASIVEGLIADIESHRSLFKKSGIGAKAHILKEARGDYILWLEDETLTTPQKKVFEYLENLKKNLNEKLFLGVQDFECHFAFYPPSSGYVKHIDQVKNSTKKRKISFIFYLNKNWQDGDGGELVLYNKENKILEKISPTVGKLVLFDSADFPHEVLTNKNERLSLTGWMFSTTDLGKLGVG